MKSQFIPNKIGTEATRLLSALFSSKHWSQLGGKRYQLCIPMLVVFPLSGRYGIVCRYKQESLVQCNILSQKQYQLFSQHVVSPKLLTET